MTAETMFEDGTALEDRLRSDLRVVADAMCRPPVTVSRTSREGTRPRRRGPRSPERGPSGPIEITSPFRANGGASRGGRVVAGAAAAVVALLFAGLALVSRSHDRPSSVRAGSPTEAPSRPGASGSVDPGPSPAANGPATGLYIADPLPAGWRVASVSAVPEGGSLCPCRKSTWTDRSGRVLELYRHVLLAGDPIASQEHVNVDLGAGVLGAVSDNRDQMVWVADGTVNFLTAEGITDDELVQSAKAVVAEPDAEQPPAPGLTLLDRVIDERTGAGIPGDGLEVSAEVDLQLVAPGGGFVTVAIHAPQSVSAYQHAGAPTTIEIPGRPWPLLVSVPAVVAPGPSGEGAVAVGHWPGADLSITVSGSENPRGDIRALAEFLQPATPVRWRAFLAGVSGAGPAITDVNTLAEIDATP